MSAYVLLGDPGAGKTTVFEEESGAMAAAPPRQARDSQRVVRRDAEYSHPNVQQVCETLRNGPPANAADLAGLVMDRLRQIAGRIRTGNSNDWRHYWNEDQYGRPQNPKAENSCRDALIPFLEAKLPVGIRVGPEERGIADTRADICVSWADFKAPIEIKRNIHQNLWSAMRDQLIEKYMRHAAVSSHGVYLVLWFGKEKCQLGAGGRPERRYTPCPLPSLADRSLSDAPA